MTANSSRTDSALQDLCLSRAAMAEVGSAAQTLAGLLALSKRGTFARLALIAEAACLPVGTVRRHLAKLELAGWLTKAKPPPGRRTPEYTLTAKAAEQRAPYCILRRQDACRLARWSDRAVAAVNASRAIWQRSNPDEPQVEATPRLITGATGLSAPSVRAARRRGGQENFAQLREKNAHLPPDGTEKNAHLPAQKMGAYLETGLIPKQKDLDPKQRSENDRGRAAAFSPRNESSLRNEPMRASGRQLTLQENGKSIKEEIPAGLTALIAAWNELAQAGYCQHQRSATKALRQAWATLSRRPEFAPVLSDPSHLTVAILNSVFLHRKHWLTLEWVLAWSGKPEERTGDNLRKVLVGRYADAGSTRARSASLDEAWQEFLRRIGDPAAAPQPADQRPEVTPTPAPPPAPSAASEPNDDEECLRLAASQGDELAALIRRRDMLRPRSRRDPEAAKEFVALSKLTRRIERGLQLQGKTSCTATS